MRTIPILDQRDYLPSLPGSDDADRLVDQPTDSFDRPLQVLCISVTDRSNLKPIDGYSQTTLAPDGLPLPRSSLLSFEEITHLAQQFVTQGVKKIRLTGGEPLVRRNIETLVAQLAALRTPDGAQVEIALTTNGSLLSHRAQSLKEAGLQQVTVKLDGLDEEVVRRLNHTDVSVAEVLAGLTVAHDAGFDNLTINMVIKRGVNEQEILPMARYFQGTGTTLRLIESSNVDASDKWCVDEVLSSADVVSRIHQVMPLVALAPDHASATPEMWGYAGADGQHDPRLGEIGVISSVSNPFCGICNRARLSAQGRLTLCSFATDSHDLASLIRQSGGVTDRQLQHQIAKIWRSRSDCPSEKRTNALVTERAHLALVGKASTLAV